MKLELQKHARKVEVLQIAKVGRNEVLGTKQEFNNQSQYNTCLRASTRRGVQGSCAWNIVYANRLKMQAFATRQDNQNNTNWGNILSLKAETHAPPPDLWIDMFLPSDI
eukprot:1159613-Pelagomonas_calceolata.AAC.13